MKDPRKRLWRTLIRVESVGKKFIWVVIPGWNHIDLVRVRSKKIPKKIRKKLETGFRFYAHVNIGAEHSKDFRFKKWELG